MPSYVKTVVLTNWGILLPMAKGSAVVSVLLGVIKLYPMIIRLTSCTTLATAEPIAKWRMLRIKFSKIITGSKHNKNIWTSSCPNPPIFKFTANYDNDCEVSSRLPTKIIVINLTWSKFLAMNSAYAQQKPSWVTKRQHTNTNLDILA